MSLKLYDVSVDTTVSGQCILQFAQFVVGGRHIASGAKGGDYAAPQQ